MRQKQLINTSKFISLEDALEVIKKSGRFYIKELKEIEIKTTNSFLIEYFYLELEKIVGKEYSLLINLNDEKDFKAIQLFQNRGKELGLLKNEVNSLIYDYIKFVFKYYDKLKLDYPPNTLYYLLTEGRWIIKKAIDIHKQYKLEYKYSKEYEELIDKFCYEETEKIKEFKNNRHRELRKFISNRKVKK